MPNLKPRSYLKKVIVSVFVLSLVLSLSPIKAFAFWGVEDIVWDPTNNVETALTSGSSAVTAGMSVIEKVKHFILDPLAWVIAKNIVQGITAQTVNWINSGFKGNPAYVTNPSDFFLNIGDTTASKFLSETQLNKLCSPFQAQIRLALVRHYLQSEQNYSCSLSVLRNNYDSFINNFSSGGWTGWFELTQIDANNPYGAYTNAENQLDLQVTAAQETKHSDVSYGSGFLSFQKCQPEYVITQAQWNNFGAGLKAIYKVGDCYGDHMENVTPGSVINNQLEKVLGSGIDQLNLADSFNEIISALVTQLTKKLIGGLGDTGLKGTSNTITIPPDVDPSLPNLVVIDPNPLDILQGQQFRDPGAIAVDAKDGDITSKIQKSGSVNVNVVARYTITYKVTNSAGKTATATRDVCVTRVVKTANGNVVEGSCNGSNGTTPNYSESTYGGGNIGGGGGGQCNDVGGAGVNFSEAQWRSVIEAAECTPLVTSQGLQCVQDAVSALGGSVQRNTAGMLRSRVYLAVATIGETCTKAVDISSANCEDCGGSWVWIRRF